METSSWFNQLLRQHIKTFSKGYFSYLNMAWWVFDPTRGGKRIVGRGDPVKSFGQLGKCWSLTQSLPRTSRATTCNWVKVLQVYKKSRGVIRAVLKVNKNGAKHSSSINIGL